MSVNPPLPLSDIVSISVSVSAASATAGSFNQGLFIGPSAVIPSYGSNSRLRQYASTAAMLADGFTISDPEYIAAQIYFSQTPTPQFIWIGRQDLTAISTMTIDAAGTGWAVGDQFNIGGAGTNAIGQVTAETGGVPSAIALVQQGTGYADAVGVATTAISPSAGTGLTITITAVGESLLQAATACRNANNTWYGLAVNNPADADNLALAAWADALWQTTRYYAWTSDVGVANGVSNNIALQLQEAQYRTELIYSTTQSSLVPNNIYAAAALMGLEMGSNTGLAGSFFTSAHKKLAGIIPEPISQTQFSNLKTADCNVYANFSSIFLLEPGVLSNGTPAFLWLYLAMLVANIQINEVNVLASQPAVAQTNAGEQLLINAASQACQLLANIGFIAEDNWDGASLSIVGVSMQNGQPIPGGFSVQAQPYSQQSSGDRAAGKAMPLYIFIITAGAVQSLLIGVYTQL